MTLTTQLAKIHQNPPKLYETDAEYSEKAHRVLFRRHQNEVEQQTSKKAISWRRQWRARDQEKWQSLKG